MLGGSIMAESPLISREGLFGNPDRSNVDRSPDGQNIAFLAPLEGVLNIWVAPADKTDQVRPVTHDTGRGIRQYVWAFTNQHILYLQDSDGDENWRIYAVEVNSGYVRNLTPFNKVNGRILKLSDRRPEGALLLLNDRDEKWHDAHLFNITTGESTLVFKNGLYRSFIADDDLVLRLATRLLDDGSSEVSRLTDGVWQPWFLIPEADEKTTGFLTFDQGGQAVYMSDSRGRNTAALVKLDLLTGQTEPVAQNPRADITGGFFHPTNKQPQIARSTFLRQEWQVLDPAIKTDYQYLKSISDGEITISSRSLDDRYWLVSFVVANGPVRYYRYDRQGKKAEFLFVDRQALEGLTLAEMQPVVIKSMDGLDLVSYLSLPPWMDGQSAKPLPMVVLVHGGPWNRDSFGLHTWVQWLANRGYAVLQVNFRGSTGFGKDFINASIRQWGQAMHADILDGVQWAINQGIADPKRIGIFGGSYGGYETLIAMTLSPEVFACGVSMCGPSNLQTLLDSYPVYWGSALRMWQNRVGNNTTEDGKVFLALWSPLNHIQQIVHPLLILQGGKDPRVTQKEADQMAHAMKVQGAECVYVLFPNEGHGFTRPENQIASFAATEAFLAQYLGGRCEPIGDDLKKSSIQIVDGQELIPGLQ